MARPTLRRPVAVVVALVIAAAGAWAYSTSFAGVFVFDDGPAIVENPHIRSIWPLTRSMTAPPEVTVSGRPVACLSLALNYALAPADVRDVMTPVGPTAPPGAADRFHRNVWGYHLLNLAVHVGAGLALFGLIRRSLLAPALAGRYGAHASALAFVASLTWLVHPLHTQAVTYVVQRVESLMGLFYLLTMYCAIRAAESQWNQPDPGPADPGQPAPDSKRPSRLIGPASFGRRASAGWWSAGAVAACAAGMGCKEVMVGAPLMVWAWDHVFGVNHRRRWPLYAGLAATWLILAALVAGETRPQSVGTGLGWTWWSYLATQAGVIVHYLRLALWPSPLVFDYDWPQARSLGAVVPPAALLLTLVAASTVALFRRKPIALAGAWFFAILAPTSSVLPITTEIAAEHRLYLPLAAVVVVLVIGFYEVARRLLSGSNPGASGASRVGLVAVLVLTAAVVGPLAESTRARNRAYWSDEGLWWDTVQKRPGNARARVGYSINLLSAGRFAEAEAQLRIAVGLDDGYARAHMNLGSALAARGKADEGIAHLERARALDPRIKETYGLLGEAYAGRGQPQLSVAAFQTAVELLPDNPFLLRRVAWLLSTWPGEGVRDGVRALALAERAVQLTGARDLESLDTLAAARAEAGDTAGAVAATEEALSVALGLGDQSAVRVLQGRLARYRAGFPLREPWR